MEPITTAAIAAGGIAAASGLLDTGVNAWSGFEQQKRNFEEAQRARDFEKYMASNKYQLMVSDLQKAGLNPSLALGSATGGAGASAPTGVSTASGVGSNIGGKIMSAVNSYIGASLKNKENEKLLYSSLKAELSSYSAKNWKQEAQSLGWDTL